jgi:hypothetical protein
MRRELGNHQLSVSIISRAPRTNTDFSPRRTPRARSKDANTESIKHRGKPAWSVRLKSCCQLMDYPCSTRALNSRRALRAVAVNRLPFQSLDSVQGGRMPLAVDHQPCRSECRPRHARFRGAASWGGSLTGKMPVRPDVDSCSTRTHSGCESSDGQDARPPEQELIGTVN